MPKEQKAEKKPSGQKKMPTTFSFSLCQKKERKAREGRGIKEGTLAFVFYRFVEAGRKFWKIGKVCAVIVTLSPGHKVNLN